MSPETILDKVRLLGEAGLKPRTILLRWETWDGKARPAWTLEIGNYAWLRFGTPAVELTDWLTELAISEDCEPFKVRVPQGGPVPDYPGVTMGGGLRAPSLHMSPPGGRGMLEQYEAALEAVRKKLSVYAKDEGHEPGGLRLWRRFCFSDWFDDFDRELRAKYLASRKAETGPLPMPDPENPVIIRGRAMYVLRPCGCITQHWRAPGRGNGGLPSKLRFGHFLSRIPCLKCL